MGIKMMKKRRDIVKEHDDRLDDVQYQILELMRKSINDKRSDGEGGIGLRILNDLKAYVQFSRKSSLGMESHDRLELSKMWFDHLTGCPTNKL
ncbi:MAG TPA: hypothetical protein EYP28_04800 [Methanophagales archaeon]|nr:hypothetical protein [Methanophagales archaeon]